MNFLTQKYSESIRFENIARNTFPLILITTLVFSPAEDRQAKFTRHNCA